MKRHLRNFHHGIRVMTDHGEVRLLTVGYLAAALRRTRWTILHWEQLELIPQAPFVMNPHQYRGKRRLYPEPFIRELSRITDRHYSGPRLDQEEWPSFQGRVFDAYEQLVIPHLGDCYPPVEIELDSGQEAGAMPGNDGLSTTTNA